MTRQLQLEKIIGKRPEENRWNDKQEYKELLQWEQKAREHETARAERWKEQAKLCHASYTLDEVYPEKLIESIDKGSQ